MTTRDGLCKRLWNATRYSWAGLRDGFRTQVAIRLELLTLLVLAPAAWLLTERGVDRALLIGGWLLVIIVELVNSAIETVVDRIGKEQHELSGRAKDLGSAAVFCAIVLCVGIWFLVLSDR